MNENKKVNILIGIDVLGYGGAEKVLKTILENIDYDVYNIEVIVLHKLKNNIELHPKVNITYLYNYYNEYLQDRNSGYTMLDKEVFNKRYDLKISFMIGLMSDILNRFGNKDAKFIGWLHGDLFSLSDQLKWYYKSYIRDYLDMDKIICCSNKSRLSLISIISSELERTSEVIYNPLDVELIKEYGDYEVDYKKENCTIVAVGRLSWEKGHERLIYIHEMLNNAGIENTVLLIGEGPDEQRLKSIVAQKKLEKTFKFMGYKKNPYPWIKLADIFVLPSYTEAYPLVVGEAMILNKPIVAPDIGGIRELLKDNYGMIVENSNEAILEGIRKLIEDENLRNRFIENLKNIEKYDFDKNEVMEKIKICFKNN